MKKVGNYKILVLALLLVFIYVISLGKVPFLFPQGDLIFEIENGFKIDAIATSDTSNNIIFAQQLGYRPIKNTGADERLWDVKIRLLTYSVEEPYRLLANEVVTLTAKTGGIFFHEMYDEKLFPPGFSATMHDGSSSYLKTSFNPLYDRNKYLCFSESLCMKYDYSVYIDWGGILGASPHFPEIYVKAVGQEKLVYRGGYNDSVPTFVSVGSKYVIVVSDDNKVHKVY